MAYTYDDPLIPTLGYNPLWGKYRGTVVATNDPAMMGRVRAVVPYPCGMAPLPWASPCFQSGQFFTPSVGDGVWIEFEAGNPDAPIWSGIWYRLLESPLQQTYPQLQANDEEANATDVDDLAHAPWHDHKTAFYTPHVRAITTPTGHALLFDDWRHADGSPGGGQVVLRHREGMALWLEDGGRVTLFGGEGVEIEISKKSGQITVTGNAVVVQAANVYLGDGTETGSPKRLMTEDDAEAIGSAITSLKTTINTHTHVAQVNTASGTGTAAVVTTPNTAAYTPTLTTKTKAT